uniref:CN hydrolase domain-containing protein n=1 Tax=Bionectria ochroleuca TaxID=29856 RepID=A0A8H7NQT7_BIOOC
MSQGEQIHVSAWPSLTPHTGGPDLWSMSAEGCQALSRTYAIEGSTFVLHSTALITEKGVALQKTEGGSLMSSPGGGSSAIFAPDGRKISTDIDPTTKKDSLR